MKFTEVFTEERYRRASRGLWLDALKGLNLNDVDLSACVLKGADLSRCGLENADLSDSDLKNTNMSCCDLNATNFRHADLSGANLSNSYCSLADFTRANLNGADLTKTDLTFARFDGATLEGTKLGFLQNISEGNGKELVAITLDQYRVVIFYPTKKMAIGCKQYSFKKWFSFSEEAISEMDTYALPWWRKNSPTLQALCNRR